MRYDAAHASCIFTISKVGQVRRQFSRNSRRNGIQNGEITHCRHFSMRQIRQRARERERERFNSDRTRDVPRERQRADADRKCESTGIGDLFPETASLDSPLRFGLRVRTHARATAVGRPLRGRSATPLERRARNYSREHRSTRVELYIKYIHKIHTIRISRGTHAGFTLISEHIRAI